MASKFEIVAWSYVEGTEDVAEWTILEDGKDTMIVDDSREALQQWIDQQER